MAINMVLRYIKRHIMLKREFINAIRRGEKKATIRLGRVKVYSREILIHAGGQIIAKAVIKSVRYKKVRDLNDEDAKLDGLKNREELLRELKRIYGKISDDDVVTIIEFDVIQHLNIPEDYFWRNTSPHKIAKLAVKHLNLNKEEREILETIIKTKSIRKTSKILFGSLYYRPRIRNLLKKCVVELTKQGVIKDEI